MPFDEPPSLVNATPGVDYNLVDPMDNLTIIANVYDAENNFNIAQFEWTNQNGTWNSEVVYNETPYSYNTRLNVTFLPETEGVYSYRFILSDSEGNIFVSPVQNISVEWDCSWEVISYLKDFAGWDSIDNVGNVTLTNLGDVEYAGGCDLQFRLSYNLDESRVYYDGNYLIPSDRYYVGEKESVNISIDIDYLSEIVQEDVSILFDEVSRDSDERYRHVNFTIISNQEGAYMLGEITESPAFVYLNDETFGLDGYYRNVMGSDAPNVNNTAFNVSIYWTMPDGVSGVNVTKLFDNISDSLPVLMDTSFAFDSLSSMSPGTYSFELIAIGYDKYGVLMQNSIGEEKFSEMAEISFMCYSEVDSICVEACGYAQDPDCEIPVVEVPSSSLGSSGGGGGGGASGPVIEESSQNYELVIGESRQFEFLVENDLNLPKKNIEVYVTGVGSSDIVLSDNIISRIEAGKTHIVKVDLSSKAYQLQETLDLIFTVRGMIEEGDVSKSFVERISVKLNLLEIPREEADKLFNLTTEIVREMEFMNLSTRIISDEVMKINESYYNIDFLGLKEAAEEIEFVYESAKSSKDLIEKLEEDMALSEAMGIDILESKKMYLVAKKAYQRGDYKTALAKLEEARLNYVLETKGKFNLIGYIKYKPYHSTSYFVFAFLFISTIVIFSKSRYYKRRISGFRKDQKSYLTLMKLAQVDCFEKKKMSMGEYNVAVASCREGLAKSVQKEIEYEEKLIGISKLGSSMKVLEKQKKRLLALVKGIQHDYMVKGHMDTTIYELMLKSYMSRIAEVEEKVVSLEARKSLRRKY
jgi:hypothetical protein